MSFKPIVNAGVASIAFLLPTWANSTCAVMTQDARQNGLAVQSEEPVRGDLNVVAQSESIAEMEAAVYERINDTRIKHGLEPLQDNTTLNKIARDYSHRMEDEGFFSHYDPSGRDVAGRLQSAGLSFRWVGENIFKSYNVHDPVETAVQGWMQSQGHRENILRKEFTETGVGIWKEGKTYHFTQVFRRPP